jgi:methyl-accepting chemotaxis protein
VKIIHKIVLMPSLAVVALVVVFGVVQVTRSVNDDLTRRIETGFVPAVTMSQDLVEMLAALQRGLQDAVASADPSLFADTDEIRLAFLQTVDRAGNNETLDAGQLEELGRSFDEYYDLARGSSARLINGEYGEDLQTALRQTVDRYNAIKATLDEISKGSSENISRAFARSRTNESRATILYLVVLVVCIGLLVALSSSVIRSISRSLDRVTAVAAGVADGQLTHRIEVVGEDELGTMGAALNRALEKMRAAVAAFGDNARALAGASDELNGISRQMSGGADANSEQATMASGAAEQVSASVESVAVGIEEMSASIREIAVNSQEAATVAANAVNAAQDTNRLITRLGERSTEISGVVKVISDIAGQTNLLALNATIEAARAGEFGRGFAVVADEVKELARGTAAATGDISTRMESIQADIDSGVQAIGNIATIIDRISEIQSSIALAVEQQTATASEISRSINEAARGSSEIAAHVLEVARSAQVTVDGASATRRSAESLSLMAAELREHVANFRYRD